MTMRGGKGRAVPAKKLQRILKEMGFAPLPRGENAHSAQLYGNERGVRIKVPHKPPRGEVRSNLIRRIGMQLEAHGVISRHDFMRRVLHS